MDSNKLVEAINKMKKEDITDIFKSYTQQFFDDMHDYQIDLYGRGLPIIQTGWKEQKDLVLTVGSRHLYQIIFEKFDIEYMINIFEQNKEIIKEKVKEYAPRFIANEKSAKEFIQHHLDTLATYDFMKMGCIKDLSAKIDWLNGTYNVIYNFKYGAFVDKMSMSFDLYLTEAEFNEAYVKGCFVDEAIEGIEENVIKEKLKNYENQSQGWSKPIKKSLSVLEKYAIIDYAYKTQNMDLARKMIPYSNNVPIGARDKFDSLMVAVKLLDAGKV